MPTAPGCISAPYHPFPQGQFNGPGRDMPWMPGGFLTISADGDSNGIVWVSMPYADNANTMVVRGVLRAFDASDVSKPQLWDSENTGQDANRLGRFAKFCSPVVFNGKVYIPAFQAEMIRDGDKMHLQDPDGDKPALVIYGLKNP